MRIGPLIYIYTIALINFLRLYYLVMLLHDCAAMMSMIYDISGPPNLPHLILCVLLLQHQEVELISWFMQLISDLALKQPIKIDAATPPGHHYHAYEARPSSVRSVVMPSTDLLDHNIVGSYLHFTDCRNLLYPKYRLLDSREFLGRTAHS